jgi:sulfatase maturation enzyme AslB (radical SAM superfamily)
LNERVFVLSKSLPKSTPARQIKSFYNPPSLIFKQALSLACHGWLTGWAGFPAWMLKGKKVLRTAAGATAIGCTGYPYHVVWEVTTRCNLNCIHCYASSVDSAQTELTTAEGKRFLDDVAAVGDIRMIVITGGEPLLRKDIFELVEYAGKLGLSIIFSTNGTLLTPDIAKDLVKLGVANFSISLDGSAMRPSAASPAVSKKLWTVLKPPPKPMLVCRSTLPPCKRTSPNCQAL